MIPKDPVYTLTAAVERVKDTIPDQDAEDWLKDAIAADRIGWAYVSIMKDQYGSWPSPIDILPMAAIMEVPDLEIDWSKGTAAVRKLRHGHRKIVECPVVVSRRDLDRELAKFTASPEATDHTRSGMAGGEDRAAPFNEPYWNLIQVLAWVYLGDRSLVRRASDNVTDHGSFLQEVVLPDGRTDLAETPAGTPGLGHLVTGAAWQGGAAYDNFNEAKGAVITASKVGKLHVLGLKNNRGDLEEIPPTAWAELDFYFEPPHAAPRHPNYSRREATRWYELKYLSNEILTLWPDMLDEIALSDHEPAPLPAPPEPTSSSGRPTLKTEIEAAYKALRDGAEIDFKAPKNRVYEPIREKVRGYKKDPRLQRGLGDEAIRKVIHPLFEKDKSVHSTSP